GSATKRSHDGRTEYVYFHTARVPSRPSRASGTNRQPPPNEAKNQGPFTIVMPTDVGGRYETYSETIRGPTRARVCARTPFAGTAASIRCCPRMSGSHRIRMSPVVCETANATSGETGTHASAVTWGIRDPRASRGP